MQLKQIKIIYFIFTHIYEPNLFVVVFIYVSFLFNNSCHIIKYVKFMYGMKDTQ